MKTSGKSWPLSYSCNTAATGVEGRRGLRRRGKKSCEHHVFVPQKIAQAFGKSLELLCHFFPASRHKDVVFCHSPKDWLPLASSGPGTPSLRAAGFHLPPAGPAVLKGRGSVNTRIAKWNLWNRVNLHSLQSQRTHWFFFSPISHLGTTVWLWFSVAPLGLTQEAKMWLCPPVLNVFLWCLGLSNSVFHGHFPLGGSCHHCRLNKEVRLGTADPSPSGAEHALVILLVQSVEQMLQQQGTFHPLLTATYSGSPAAVVQTRRDRGLCWPTTAVWLQSKAGQNHAPPHKT